MYKIVLTILLFISLQLNAQQWVQFSQQALYNTYLNTAYTGYDSNLNAVVAHRSQYVGLGTKSIASQFASFSMPVFSPKFGLGFRMINDFIGFQRYSDIEINSAYHILNKKHKLSVGIGLGIVQLGIDGSSLTAPDGNYLPGVVIHNDDYIPNVKSSGLAPTFSAGIIYGYKKFIVGAAIQNINSPQFKITNTNNGTIIFINRTININASYVINLKSVKIVPSVFMKTDLNKLQAQVDLQTYWKKIVAGVGFRGYNGLNNDAIIGMLGVRIKDKVQISYSYDYNLSYLNNSNSGSHEISMKLDLKRNFVSNVKEKIFYNPRFL